MPHLNLLNIQLITGAVPATSALADTSWLLTSLTRVRDDVVIAVAADDLRKDASLGRLFSNQVPQASGGYEIELGFVLPGWLPSPPAAQDWSVTVSRPGPPPDSLVLSFSNQMRRYRYGEQGDTRHVLVPAFAVAQAIERKLVPEGCTAEVLHTMASVSVHIAGADAEAALETSLDAAVDRFVEALNRVIDAYLLVATPEQPMLFFTVDRGSIDYFYLLVQGGSDAAPSVSRAALSSYRIARVPGELDADRHATLLRHVAEPSDTHLPFRFMAAGRSSLESGLLELALLQLVIAAEIATGRAVHNLLLANGVSRTKRDRYGRDLTYSETLNLLLVSLAPASDKPDPEILGMLNRGRDARNDLMHSGAFATTRADLRQLLEATTAHLSYLDRIAPPAGAT